MPVTDVGEVNLLSIILDAETLTFTVRLAKSPIPPDIETLLLADIVEADFIGYSPIVDPEFTTVEINDANYAQCISAILAWTAGIGVVAQNITAVYVTVTPVGGTEKLFWFNPLPLPVAMNTAEQVFEKRIKMSLANMAS